MTLWDDAVGRYARPGVEAACLRLQDDHGQCAPLLLWRLWTIDQRRPVSAVLLVEAAQVARAWSEAAITPLRSARRRLKGALPPIDDDARTSLREAVQSLELQAERALLEALEALTPPSDGVPSAPAPALVEAARAWGGETPPLEALEALAACGTGAV